MPNAPNLKKDFYKVAEAAQVLGLGYQATYQLITSRKLDARQVGCHWIITRDSLQQYIDQANRDAQDDLREDDDNE